MNKIIFTETIKIVQLQAEDVIREVGEFGLGVYEDNASFIDKDQSLKEVLISIGDIENMLDKGFSNEYLSNYLVELKKAMDKEGASYVQIVKI